MKIKMIFLLFVFIRLTGFSQLSDHFVITSAGDYYIGSNATLSWTLGEPVIEYNTSKNHSLTQGFQQVFFLGTDLPEISSNSPPQVSIYPIPVEDVLHVEISTPSTSVFLIELYDLMGQLVYFNEAEGVQIHMKIPMSQFVSNLFFLKLTNKVNNEVKIVKVLKINQ